MAHARMEIFDWTKDYKIPESAAATPHGGTLHGDPWEAGREPKTSTTSTKSPTRMTQPNQQTDNTASAHKFTTLHTQITNQPPLKQRHHASIHIILDQSPILRILHQDIICKQSRSKSWFLKYLHSDGLLLTFALSEMFLLRLHFRWCQQFPQLHLLPNRLYFIEHQVRQRQ